MKVSDKEISEQFSKGNFSFCYEYFDDSIEWNIIGTKSITGKQDVVAYCDKMMPEMNGSILNNTNVIASNGNIAIEGYCDYTNADNQQCKVSYCDIYYFENNKLAKITSYCIDKKI